MLQISSKIAEVVDNVITQNASAEMWRGDLTTQNWKIFVQYENNRLLIKAARRDGNGGDPE